MCRRHIVDVDRAKNGHQCTYVGGCKCLEHAMLCPLVVEPPSGGRAKENLRSSCLRSSTTCRRRARSSVRRESLPPSASISALGSCPMPSGNTWRPVNVDATRLSLCSQSDTTPGYCPKSRRVAASETGFLELCWALVVFKMVSMQEAWYSCTSSTRRFRLNHSGPPV